MAARAAVNQIVQLGKETTHGTPVAAGKLISAWTWTFGEKAVTKQFTATGRKFPSSSAILTEMAEGKTAGHLDFAASVYPLSSLWGAATVALVGASSTAYGWTWTPALAGPYAPISYTAQQGNATDDSQQYAYLVFNEWGYTFTRKQEVESTGAFFAQTFTDGASLTASPTNIALMPATGVMANVYLDTSSGGIGGTQLTNPLKVDFKASNYYGQYWPINRSNASFTSHLDLLPKNELKLTLMADATAIALRASYLQADTVRAYISVNVTGPVIDAGHSVNAQMTHNMACFMSDMSEMSDVDGVYGFESTWQVAEDTTWGSGQAQTLLLQNLLSAL